MAQGFTVEQGRGADPFLANAKQPMGLGALRNPQLRFKRKFRWTLEIAFCTGQNKVVAKEFCKTASRPNIQVEETEINYLNGKMFIPGKATLETITVTYYDATLKGAEGTNNPQTILAWVASVYDFTNPTDLEMGAYPDQYEGVGRLTLFDACGNPLEGWLMDGMWPTNVNFGELDMSASEECTIELTIRYRDVRYKNYCGSEVERCPCVGC